MDVISTVLSAFEKIYGYAPTHLFAAPGGINLMEDPLDADAGLALAIALNQVTVVAAARRGDQVVRLAEDGSASPPLVFEAGGTPCGGQRHLAYHVQGVICQLWQRGYRSGGMDLAFASNVPRGAGMGAAISLTVAVGLAADVLYELQLDPTLLAQLVQRAQVESMGSHCCIEGPLIAVCGEPNRAKLIDRGSLRLEPVALPAKMTVLVLGRSSPAAGVGEALRRQYREFAQKLGARGPDGLSGERLQPAGGSLALELVQYVADEHQRIRAAAQALGEGDMLSLGQLMEQSHRALLQHSGYRNPGNEAVVTEVAKLLNGKGGVRMLASGAVLALAPQESVAALSAMLTRRIPDLFVSVNNIHACQAGQGAHQLYFE